MTRTHAWMTAVLLAACGGQSAEPATQETTLQPAESTAPAAAPTQQTEVSPIPEGYHAVTPAIVVPDIEQALAFYEAALGAERTQVTPGPDGSPVHAEMRLGDSVVMLTPEGGEQDSKAPSSLGGTNGALMVYVPDVDAAFTQAKEAGATEVMAPTDMFWGDRYGQVQDPYGHRWSLATHRFDVPDEEMGERAQAWMAAMAAGEQPPSFEGGEPASSHQPEGWPTVSPSLVVASADAVEFWVNALGAEEVSRMVLPDGTLMHAELRVGDSVVMMGGEQPEMDDHMKAPGSLDGRVPVSLMLYVDDVDAVFASALEAGATERMPVRNMFWGDRFGEIRTPAGHALGIATHVEDVPPEEIQARMREQMQAE